MKVSTKEKISNTRKLRIKQGKIKIKSGVQAPHFTGGQIHHGYRRILRKGFPLSDGRGYCKMCNSVWYDNTQEIVDPKTHVIIHMDGNKLNDNFQNLKKVTKEKAKEIRYKAVSDKLKGHKVKMQTRVKIAAKLSGKSYLTEEGRQKLSSFQKGRPKSMEAKLNMKAAQKLLAKQGKMNRGGKRNPGWKGGLWHNMGYIYIHKPGFSTTDATGYIKRANYIWFQNTDELIIPPYFLHHINGNKEDDRFENLQKVTRKEHMDIHRKDLK